MQIFTHPVIRTACEAPIPNWHSDLVGPGLDSEIFSPTPGFRSRSAVAAPDALGFRHPFSQTATWWSSRSAGIEESALDQRVVALNRSVGTLLVVADLSILFLLTVSHLVVFEVYKHRRKCFRSKSGR
ncbi:hypothetical protein Taro_028296 [Colocasia esculenta]|uniref:Uncharacterized protein n=1 Tax=Colocasia esculenta TaxID=4460 RepID=A0A843VTS5_COLES|nr:hypothetical protein [Colocasia esculenta]